MRYQQGTSPQIDLKLDGATLLGEIQFKQESFKEMLRHPSCEHVQARRWLSCHHLVTMEAKVNLICRCSGRYCKVHSHHQLSPFYNDVFWELVVLVKGVEHDVQELGDVFS